MCRCMVGCLQWIPIPYQPPQCVPLKDIQMSIKIVDFVAQITLRQKFSNEETNPIEAVYEFEIEPSAAVTGFVAEIDGKRITGECKEKEKAKESYDDAIASGHGAYLMEQKEQPNIFAISVGNLPPGKEVSIEVTYVKELEFKEGQLRFTIPTSQQNLKKMSQGTPSLNLVANLEMTSPVRSIASPSHPIEFEFGESTSIAKVSLANKSTSSSDLLQKDFELLIKLAKPHEPCARIQDDDKGNQVVMFSVYPNLEPEEDEVVYTEMIFLIDRSGSMSGSRINQVRSTMQILLRSLAEGTMFNIVGFGSSFKKLFSESVEYNEKNLNQAMTHVEKMQADMGGTEILQPLLSIFKEKSKPGIPRQLFILTDGEVSNTQQCIDAVRDHAQTTRVFTFGIGQGADRKLVEGMAKAGEGDFEIIVEGESTDEKVLRQLSRAMKPAITDISVTWKVPPAMQSPSRFPPLFAGNRLVIYGFFKEGSGKGTIEATISASAPKKKTFTAKMSVDASKAEKGTLFHQLAAKVLIKEFEEERSCFHTANKQLVKGKTQDDVQKEIIRLSTSYKVISKLTAFVAVEKRAEATEGEMALRTIPFATGASQFMAPPSSPRGSNRLPSFGNIPLPAMTRSSITSAPPPARGPPLQYIQQMPMEKLARRSSPPPQFSAPPPSRSAPQYGGLPSADGQKRLQASYGGLPNMEEESGYGGLPPPAPSPNYGGLPPPPPSSQPSRNYGPPAPPPPGSGPLPPPSVTAPPPPPSSSSMSNYGGLPVARSEYGGLPSLSQSMNDYERLSLEDLSPPIMAQQSSAPMQNYGGLPPAPKNRSSQSPVMPKQEEAKPQATSQAAPSALKDLIMKQEFAGKWTVDALVVVVSGLKADVIRSGLPSGAKASKDIDDVWATSIALAIFAVRYGSFQVHWDLIAKKAKKWLSKEVKTHKVDNIDWDAEATKFVQSHVKA